VKSSATTQVSASAWQSSKASPKRTAEPSPSPPGPLVGFASRCNYPPSGEFADAVRSATAVGHYGRPRDIADAVAFLARAETQFVTGTTWNVDGGYAL
jgi:NAD(P)-dependent dehydrogenase (short-subunit alcohol dehydrogenase family)